MTRREFAAGVGLGLFGSAVVLPWLRQPTAEPEMQIPRALLSDCDRPIRELVVHYTVEAANIAVPSYKQFFAQLPPDVTVHVVCPDHAAFDDLMIRVGPVDCQMSPIPVDHPVTCWSRDRWLALAPIRKPLSPTPSPRKRGEGSKVSASRSAPTDHRASTLLLTPRSETGAGVWAARQGDQRVAGDLSAALFPSVDSRRSELYFDGGDFVSDSETVFVTPAVAIRNVQQTVSTHRELQQRLESTLRRRAVLLREAPDHHAGMFMMTAGRRTVLVADPAAAKPILRNEEPALSIEPDFRAETQWRFDAVAKQCEDAGYHVVRIPTVPALNGRSYLSYVNAVIDQRQDGRVVYLPVFQGVDSLNAAAADVWSRLKFEVRPVDCTACYPHFGTLRCLVNVLRRD